MFGPLEENSAIFGADSVPRTVLVLEILATGFLSVTYIEIESGTKTKLGQYSYVSIIFFS